MQARNILREPVRRERGLAAERLNEERQRMASILAAATAPDECGGALPPAPGRGPGVIVHHITMVPAGEDERGQQKWDAAPAGYGHRASIRAADVFDRMGKAAIEGKRPAPFTAGQVAMARRYRALVERREAGAIKCTALDGRVAGSGERDFMDAYLAQGRELDAIRARIGSGVAMAIRRVRPAVRGGADRRGIPDRALVDMVCLGDRTLSDVLRAYGWVAKGETRRAAAEALSAALDRMIGYSGEKTS